MSEPVVTMIECECGCGTLIPEFNKQGRKRRFVFNHHCIGTGTGVKEKVRNRDNRTCQNCGAKENGKKLPVHHIHYDKENCYPDLITVCNSCNSKANSNRDYWEAFYINKLNERGLLFWTQNNGD